MFATDAVLPAFASDPAHHAARATTPGSIRNIEMRDLSQVARLLVANHIDARTIDTAQRQPFPRCHLLVLDVDSTVRALAYVVITKQRALRGHLQLLIVDPALVHDYGHAVEDRLEGVAVALCEAYGCAEVDIAASEHEAAASTIYPIPAYAVG